MKIEFYTKPLDGKVDFNLSDFRNYSEIATAFESLFNAEGKDEVLNIVMKTPLKLGVIIPDAFRIMLRHMEKDVTVHLYAANSNIIDHLQRYMPASKANLFECRLHEKQITIRTGDITHPFALAIVNASNTQLKLGGGVSGAIKLKAGGALQQELDCIAGRTEIDNGDAILTGAHAMEGIRFIIHAACVEGGTDTVRKSISNSLKVCNEKSIASVAFPVLGTGTGGMDIKLFADIFFEELNSFLSKVPNNPQKIFLILWTKSQFDECIKPFQNI